MQIKKNFYSDTPDIEFFLTKRCDFKKLFDLLSPEVKEVMGANTPEEYRAAWLDILATFGEMAGTTLAANRKAIEHEPLKLNENGDVDLGPILQSNVDMLKEFGVGGVSLDPKYGGMGAPFFIESACNEILSRTCPNTLSNVAWYSLTAQMIDLLGTDKERNMIIPKAARSELSGNMALTEPDAGSDLGNFRTYGDLQPDGSWKLFGSKRFITNGCGDYSLVLAKNAKGAKGLENLSLYLCFRKNENGTVNYRVTRLEEKLGLHASPTCQLEFDGSDAILLGENGSGFRYMLKLMNEARLGVSFQGVGYMNAIYKAAKDYAGQRQSWGKPIEQHEMIAEQLLDMEVELAGLRSLSYQGAYYHSLIKAGESYLKNNPNLSSEQRETINQDLSLYQKRLRRWTPLLKWWAGEKSIAHARTGMMIHGGYGYTTEYSAEYWVRHSIVLATYEGTSQIQGLMALKDTMKEVVSSPQKYFELLFGTKVRTLAEADPLKRKILKMRQIYHSAIFTIMKKLFTANVRSSLSGSDSKNFITIIKTVKRDFGKFENLRYAFLFAERLCEIKAWNCMAESLYLDSIADPSRGWITERFVNKGLNRLNFLKSEMETDDPIINSRLDDYEKPKTKPKAKSRAKAGNE